LARHNGDQQAKDGCFGID